MEFDQIKEDIKKALIKRALRKAKHAHRCSELFEVQVYKCKLCGHISYAFKDESHSQHHGCNMINYNSHVQGEYELVGTIDTELLIIDLTSILAKILDNPVLIESISAELKFR